MAKKVFDREFFVRAGRRGGKAKSKAKTTAARKNWKKRLLATTKLLDGAEVTR